MSWDIDLEIDTGNGYTEVVNVGNYTWNVSPMYKEALGYTLSELDNKKANEVIDELAEGHKKMIKKPQKYKKMNPDNGWGDYEGAKEYLHDIIIACAENPECIIRVY